MHIFRHRKLIGYKGDESPIAKGSESQSRFLLCLPHNAVVGRFKGLKLAAYTDPFIVIFVVCLFCAVEHQVLPIPLYVAKGGLLSSQFHILILTCVSK